MLPFFKSKSFLKKKNHLQRVVPCHINLFHVYKPTPTMSKDHIEYKLTRQNKNQTNDFFILLKIHHIRIFVINQRKYLKKETELEKEMSQNERIIVK